MKTIEFTTQHGSYIIVDKNIGIRAYGVYCPECDSEKPMDGVAHCCVCGAATAYGEFHDDDIDFDDDGYDADKKPVWELIGKLLDIKVPKELQSILDSGDMYFENPFGDYRPIRKDYQKNSQYLDDCLAWEYCNDRLWDISKIFLYKIL